MESSCNRHQSHVPWTGRQTFNHWTTREFLYFVLLGQKHLHLLILPCTSCLKPLLLLAWNIWKYRLPDISFTFSFPPYICLPCFCFCPPSVWPFTYSLLVDEYLLTTCNVQVYARRWQYQVMTQKAPSKSSWTSREIIQISKKLQRCGKNDYNQGAQRWGYQTQTVKVRKHVLEDKIAILRPEVEATGHMCRHTDFWRCHLFFFIRITCDILTFKVYYWAILINYFSLFH